MSERIPFNKPFVVGRELFYISQCVLGGQTAGDGPFTKRCQEALEDYLGGARILLTTSCSTALHIAVLLCDLRQNDEVVMPSYTSSAAANAVLAAGGKPVFVDVEPDSLNLNLDEVAHRLGERSRAILPRHYLGAACDMEGLAGLASQRSLFLIEDAADGFGARYHGRCLGTLGSFGAFSFHETRGPMCGEAGALAINDEDFYERAEVIREKGTNRSQFFRGQVDKYTWVDVGSSYVPSDLLAAFLAAQLEQVQAILERRKEIHDWYVSLLAPLAELGLVNLPVIPHGCQSNHGGLHILVGSKETREALRDHLARDGISAVVHFTPLHESEMGRRLGYRAGMLPVTEDVSRRVLRLPFYHELREDEVARVAEAIYAFFSVTSPLAA